MAFELVGKRRAKLTEIIVQSLKLGQTDLQPALTTRWKVTLPNKEALPMLDATLLPFLYEKNSAAQTQGVLDGVPVVSDMPQLTPAARKLGALSWKQEQSGCKLIVYQGVTGDGNIRVSDGTTSIQKIEAKEGGTVDITFDHYSSDVDADTIGRIGVLKNHEPDIELTAPEILSQQPELKDDPAEDDKEDPVTPEKALATALQQQHEGKEVTAKPPARKTPLAKKIARNGLKQSRRAKA